MKAGISDELQKIISNKQAENPDKEIVVIIGGGVSGLLTAWQILKSYEEQYIVIVLDGNTCHTQIGGNAYTVNVEVGGNPRWVDLGVNDYNAATYTNIQSLLKELDIEGKPLIDTTTWAGKQNGQNISYTSKDIENGKVDCQLARDYFRFKAEAYNDAMYGGFFDKTLETYAEKKKYSDIFLKQNLYPRVNGMYFVNEKQPVPTMTLGSIMRYYGLQEGFGTGPADRRYFQQGATHWLQKLVEGIQHKGGTVVTQAHVETIIATKDQECPPIQVNFQASSCSWWQKHKEKYKEPDKGSVYCHKIVFANHACDIINLIQNIEGTDYILKLLKEIKYNKDPATHMENLSAAIAHTDKTLLPDPKKPSTYNITIHETYEQPNPYTITYWCNSHQNDAANPKYNHKPQSDFYVTLNPSKQPSTKLNTTYKGKQISAKAHFNHNTELTGTWEVQQEIYQKHQGMKVFGSGEMYFTGGWSLGAGLHEECFLAAKLVVDKLTEKDNSIFGPIKKANVYKPPEYLNLTINTMHLPK